MVSRLLPALQYLLDDVISVDVFAHFFDSVHEVALNQLKMIINFSNFYKFLYRSGSMCILAERHRLLAHLLDDFGELLVVAVVR